MLTDSPLDMHAEVMEDIAFRRLHTDLAIDQIRQAAGSDYRRDWQPPWGPNYKGHENEYVSNMVGNLVYQNPRVSVESDMPGADQMFLQTMEVGANSWIEAVNLEDVLDDLAANTIYWFGCALSTVEITPGNQMNIRPAVRSMSPTRFFQDRTNGRFDWMHRGHMWIADKDRLLASVDPVTGEPTFDQAALRDLMTDVDVTEVVGYEMERDRKRVTNRNEVAGFEVYDRATRMIYTLGWGGGVARWIREPRQWLWHPDGPYTVFGVYHLPDQVYPLPPLAITAEKVREINAHRGKMSKDAASAASIILYDLNQPQVGEALRKGQAEGSLIVGVPGLSQQAAKDFKVGGMDPKNAEYMVLLDGELQQQSGLTDARRGQLHGQATATEVNEVAQADDSRTAYIRNKFQKRAGEIILKACWTMAKAESVGFGVSVPTQDGGFVDGWFNGGLQQWEDESMLARMKVRIQPYSMERVDSFVMQRRALQTTQLVASLAPVIPTTPFIKWEQVLNDLGESQNRKDMGSRYVDFQMLQQLQMLQLTGGAPGQPGALNGAPQGGGADNGPPMPEQNAAQVGAA